MTISPKNLTSTLIIAALLAGIAPITYAKGTNKLAKQNKSTNQIALNENTQFKKIWEEEWKWRKTIFTSNEDSVGGAASPKLPDVSAANQLRIEKNWEKVLQQLSKINYERLNEENKINFLVYKHQIETLLFTQKFKNYEKPLSSDTSFWGDLAYSARQDFRSIENYEDYISQLNDFPRYFDQNIENMRAGLKRKFTPPQVSLIGREASATSIVNAKLEDNLYFQPFKKLPSTIPVEKQKELILKAKKAINDSVVPSHQKLLDFFNNEYFPNAQKSIAAYDLPDGKAFYQQQIREFTTLDLPADEIHNFGLIEVNKIRAEMEAVIKEAKFEGDFPAFLKFLKTDSQFYVTKPQDLLDRAAWISKEFDGKAKDYFGRLPRSRFAIVPTPPDIAPFYTAGRGGPGEYTLNTYNLPSRPLYSLPALTLHESAPGHAFQMPLALENEKLPEFRKEYYISAYGEGWALYAERLGDEMGMYHTPYEKFGMLSYQMWRAARLVVDTGIHTKGWSREQAQNYLRSYTALSEHEIVTEIDRYIAWPGQALSYYIGEDKIWKLRYKAEKALGAKFDIRQFHDTILEMGSVPLSVLEVRIDKFIKDGGKGPY